MPNEQQMSGKGKQTGPGYDGSLVLHRGRSTGREGGPCRPGYKTPFFSSPLSSWVHILIPRRVILSQPGSGSLSHHSGTFYTLETKWHYGGGGGGDGDLKIPFSQHECLQKPNIVFFQMETVSSKKGEEVGKHGATDAIYKELRLV